MVDQPHANNAPERADDVGAHGRREIKPGLRGQPEGARAAREPAMAYTAPGGAATGHGTDIDAHSRDEDLGAASPDDPRAGESASRMVHSESDKPTATLQEGARGADRLRTER